MNSLRHICIVSDNYPTREDPVSPFVAQLAEAIVKLGVAVTIIAPQSYVKVKIGGAPAHPQRRCIEYDNARLTIFQPYCLSFSGYTPKLNEWSRRRAVEKCFERLESKPDVCYGHFWHSGYYIYRKAKKYNLPLFVATGESVISFSANTDIKKKFCDYVKGVICVSTKNKIESIDKGLTNTDKCIVVPNAINNKVFRLLDKPECRKSLGVNEDDFVVAFVGWFSERKGSLRVAEAINKLKIDNIKSMFIGSGPVEFEPQCENIIFKGRLSHEDIPRYLNAADVFVLPTQNEGCCNAIVEAMACGLPVISSKLPFNFDILDEDNSVMVDPQDVDEIAHAIHQLFDDKVEVKRLSQNATQTSKSLEINNRAKTIMDFIQSKM